MWLKAIIIFILNLKCQFNLIIPNFKLFIYNTIQYNTIQYNTIQYNLFQLSYM